MHLLLWTYYFMTRIVFKIIDCLFIKFFIDCLFKKFYLYSPQTNHCFIVLEFHPFIIFINSNDLYLGFVIFVSCLFQSTSTEVCLHTTLIEFRSD